jgi:polysaccharide export outer membrane protein
MKKQKKRFFLFLIFIFCSFLFLGCARMQEKLLMSEVEPPKPLPAEESSSFEYRLGDFDELEIKVWEGAAKMRILKGKDGSEAKEYLISRGDTLNIYVWQWEDLNRDVIVRPDGRISFPLVGEIMAEGLTLTELDDLITGKLKEYIKYPEVSIMVREFGETKFGLKRISQDLPERLTVRPDGRISFPLVGEIMVRGMTLRELHGKLAQELSNFIPSPEVYVNLLKIGGKKVIVLGEVSSPGVYKPQANTRLTDVIALAGGYTKDAALGSVILIRGGLSSPKAEKINLANIVRGDLRNNADIQAEDIVYVPKTAISNMNYFLEQLLGPLKSSGAAVTSIKTIRERTSPFLSSGTAQSGF